MELSGECNAQTREKHKKRLLRFARQTDLFDSVKTTKFLLNYQRQPNPCYTKAKQSNKPLTRRYIKHLIDTYAIFCRANQISFDKPKVKWEKTPQIIPTTDQVKKIIASSSSKYSSIFIIMSETGAEGEELRRTPLKNIDLEQGIINLVGTKQHNSGIYKLKTKTAQLLRIYLSKATSQTIYPFPKPKALGEMWRIARKKASEKFNEPDLLKIPLKNLRNYAGAIFYKTRGKKDIIATQRFMRHKRIEQTQHYLQNIVLDEPEEYITRAVQLGTPNTMKEIIELLNCGYTKATEADGYQYFTINRALAPEEHKS